ncbi:MAG: class I SAM-dependent methyltransferase [Oscillospiraceae bacterium]|nr:class I SAM-dependent methyltransferase [Oscillospiraceae bacterium]
MENSVNEKNIERFSGYADLYNAVRPIPPPIITKAVLLYLKNNPDVVVDLGSGTGLSALIWKDIAKTVIGIEPNDDMLSEAEKTITAVNISFQKGLSNDTALSSESADVVAVSQAFHWFPIDSTLEEVYRILKHDGILAIFDCDWLPAVDWRVEEAFDKIRIKADKICESEEKHAIRNDKSSYVNRINTFGKFRFAKEVVCHNVEKCNHEKIIGIALSQGGIQDALKLDKAFQNDVDEFCDLVKSNLNSEFEIIFSYRLRLAIK